MQKERRLVPLHEEYTYDDYDCVDAQVRAESLHLGEAPPGCHISQAKGMTRVDRGDQRTVKAGVRL